MIKVGLIGPGRVGKLYLDTLLSFSDCSVCGILCSSELSKRNIENTYCLPTYSSDELESFFECQPDLVVIASSEWTHKHYLSACLSHDIPVIIEKPLLTDWSEYLEMRSTFDLHKVQVLPCFTTRFDHRFASLRRIKNELDETCLTITSQRDADTTAVSRVRGRFPITNWIVCHDFDLIRFITKSEIDSVHVLSDYASPDCEGNYLLIRLGLSCGGSAIVTSVWCAPAGSLARSFSFRYIGTQLVAEIYDDEQLIASLDGKQLEIVDQIDPLEANGYAESSKIMLRSFIDSITYGHKSIVGLDDAIRALKVAEACNLSMQEGRKVYINEVSS
jgi:myo-inositol 2-dehydrogenase/D-chiro-inositol 1-dehydrogenase